MINKVLIKRFALALIEGKILFYRRFQAIKKIGMRAGIAPEKNYLLRIIAASLAK